ncbi:thiaminase II [Lentilactobacillus kosonis]|uniref:Aminopyrimidine aminohydrolase n=2 Tax=Lentilactobacillus kosonis TaxID=2810561 RepID=A0A401FII1_9LACO|nr:thiaminase II [Lentilactobacillus kosonis]
MMPTITTKMRAAADNLWNQSFNHPFIKHLADGTLPMDTFRYYLKQDNYYLNNFSILHQKIANHVNDPSTKQFLIAGAKGLNDGEAEIRDDFFSKLAITANEMQTTPIAPNAYSYVAHMYHELNEGTVASACTALLPCYWLYNEIGKQLIANGSPVELYQQFIETYDSPEFTDATNQMINIVDALGEQAEADERRQMITAFVRSSYYELNFWEMAYVHEEWNN